MTITVHLQPGETLSQALVRAVLMGAAHLPPGTYTVDNALCRNCLKNPSTEPHACPFQAEINDDEEFQCTCCDECLFNCSDEI